MKPCHPLRKSLALLVTSAVLASTAACGVPDASYADPTAARSAPSDGFNTLEDPLFGGRPLQADVYFELDLFDSETLELAYEPTKIASRSAVTFGDRVWHRTTPRRFVLEGSGGEVSVTFAADASTVVVSNGEHHFRALLAGPRAVRETKAAFIGITAMSGAEPSTEVYASLGGGEVVLAVIILIGSFTIWYQNNDHDACQDYLEACQASAASACGAAGVLNVDVSCAGQGTFGQSSAGSASAATCEWDCNPGGGGDGGPVGGIPAPADEGGDGGDGGDAGDAGDAGDDNGAGNDDGNDDGGGDGDDDADAEDTDGCDEDTAGFSYGGLPSGGGIMDYASSEDPGGGGGNGDDC